MMTSNYPKLFLKQWRCEKRTRLGNEVEIQRCFAFSGAGLVDGNQQLNVCKCLHNSSRELN